MPTVSLFICSMFEDWHDSVDLKCYAIMQMSISIEIRMRLVFNGQFDFEIKRVFSFMG